jgi:glycylpeptide N-tetradecanoyltransferase
MSSQKIKMEEIIDTTLDDGNHSDGDGHDSCDDNDINQFIDASPSTSHKKNKKKKSKAAKALSVLRGKSNGQIPQELVSQVLDKVKAEGGEAAAAADQADVREVLEQLKIMDVVKGKAGLGGLNRKSMGEHKVCLSPML